MHPQEAHVWQAIGDVSSRDGANAFLLGVLFNQGQRAEKSWDAPYVIGERFGTFDPCSIAEISEECLAEILVRPPSVHRYARVMARYLLGTCVALTSQYGGDARKIWTPRMPTRQLVARLTALPGIGSHKAAVAIFLLRTVCGVKVHDDGGVMDISEACPRLLELFANRRRVERKPTRRPGDPSRSAVVLHA